MFETCYMLKVSKKAIYSPLRDSQYADCWNDVPKNFVAPSDPEVPVRTFDKMGL